MERSLVLKKPKTTIILVAPDETARHDLVRYLEEVEKYTVHSTRIPLRARLEFQHATSQYSRTMVIIDERITNPGAEELVVQLALECPKNPLIKVVFGMFTKREPSMNVRHLVVAHRTWPRVEENIVDFLVEMEQALE